MLYLIHGDNSYRIRQEISRITSKSPGDVVGADGRDIDSSKLADLVAGISLFSTDRTVIIRGLSENTTLWQDFGSWVPRVSETSTVILIEHSVDKRTKTYKILKKVAEVIEANNWTERDYRDAEAWLDKYSHSAGVILAPSQLTAMTRRATHDNEAGKKIIDQSLLAQAVNAVKGIGKISDEAISSLMPPDLNENVYELLGAALEGDMRTLERMLAHLKVTDDPYKIFGLIASQWFQLVALSVTNKQSSDVAADLGAHPFVIQKLARYRAQFSKEKIRACTQVLAQLDGEMKTSATEPWHAVERFLLEVAKK